MNTTIVYVSVREICECEGISEKQVESIVEQGIARPSRGATSSDWEFEPATVAWMKKAVRLHRDLELDWFATAMLVDLLRQRERLYRENRELKRRLQRFVD